MRVLIMGAGRVGGAVAAVLVEAGHDVTVVADAAEVDDLRARVPGAVVVAGNPTDPADLEAAGIRRADAVAALGPIDEDNLVVTSLARFEFGVARTIARVVDPARAWLYTDALGVDVALDQSDLLARLVAEELSLGEMTRLLKLRRGRFELVEERLVPGATVVGRAVRDLPLPRDCVLVAVFRDGTPLITRGDVVLQAHDEVLAVVGTDSVAELAALLGATS